MRFTHLLRHGVTAGAAAGLSAALVLWLAVEPVLRRALAVEEARGGHEHGHGEPLVSRTVQVVAGGVTLTMVGVLLGVVLAVVYACTRGRLPGGSDLGRAVVLAGGGFTVSVLLPAVTVPANPPGVGDPSTVTERSLLYLLTLLLGLLAVGTVLAAGGALRRTRLAAPVRSALTTAAGLGAAAVVVLVVPDTPDQVPADVSAALLWDFRLASLTQLGVMWLVLGVTFGVLVDARTRADRRTPVAA